jgi:hypothetical protein
MSEPLGGAPGVFLPPVRMEGPNVFALPEYGGPPDWMERGDKVCWYTLHALVMHTVPLRLKAPRGAEEQPPEITDQAS